MLTLTPTASVPSQKHQLYKNLNTCQLLLFISNLPEFNQFLNQSELIKLSSLSRRFRLNLIPTIFSKVYFNNDTEFSFNKLLKEYYNLKEFEELNNNQLHYIYHSYFQYYDRDCNSINSQITQFNDYLPKFQRFLSHLTIRQGINQPISLTFNYYNLSTLKIINTKLEYNQINILLNNIKKLNNLCLKNSNILYNSKNLEEMKDLVINLPSTLTQLHLESSYLVKGLIDDPLIAGQRFFNVISELKYCNFSIGDLTGLERLTCKNMVNNGKFIESIVSKNPNVKKLSTYLKLNEEENLRYLNITNLTSLSLQCTSDINLNYLNNYSIPNLLHLTHLKFSNLDSNHALIFISFLQNAPNLNSLEFEYNLDWLIQFNLISSKLPGLKKLKIINRKLGSFNELSNILSNTLESIEFDRFKISQVNLSNLEQNKGLKRVTIVKCSRDPSLQNFESNMSRFKNWTSYLGEDNIQCYRAYR